MKHLTLKLAVLGALGVVCAPVLATGFVELPAAGFTIGSDTTAYTLCNTTGRFGSGSGTDTVQKPTTTTNNTCAVFPTFEFSPPKDGYTLVTSANRAAVMNNTYTNGTNVTVGNVTEYVWRNAAKTYCIYGAKIVNVGNDYNLLEDEDQYFEVNDIARGGFSGRPVYIAYSTIPAVSEPVYRAGRTYTSVQHRDEAGYVDQPLTGLGSSPSINGVNTWPTPGGEPTAAQQKADLDDNWVDFTTDVNFLDDDGSTAAASGMTYVKTTCDSNPPSSASGAIRFRQTFQELAGDGVTDNSFIEVSVTGFVPPGGTITPAHTDPY